MIIFLLLYFLLILFCFITSFVKFIKLFFSGSIFILISLLLLLFLCNCNLFKTKINSSTLYANFNSLELASAVLLFLNILFLVISGCCIGIELLFLELKLFWNVLILLREFFSFIIDELFFLLKILFILSNSFG